MRIFNNILLLVTLASATNILLPLYNGPGTSGVAWEGVQNAFQNTQSVHGTIVINRASGPGPTDPDWVAGGSALANLPNVDLIGYIHTAPTGTDNRCGRPLDQLKDEIMIWKAWRDDGVNIAGIFVDETPNNGSCIDYMSELTTFVRNDADMPIVVYNPGFPARPHDLDGLYGLNPTFISSLETCFTNTPHLEPAYPAEKSDLCTGGYTVYDVNGYGSTIESTLPGWIGKENYEKTAILIHGFHDTNGNFTASADNLYEMLKKVVSEHIGAAVFTTLHWITPDEPPADIGTMVSTLDRANKDV